MEAYVDCTGMGGIGMGGMMAWMVVWGLLGLALLVAVVVGAVWAFRRRSGLEQLSRNETAQDHLKRRFAAGEIDEDEYLSRRAHLDY